MNGKGEHPPILPHELLKAMYPVPNESTKLEIFMEGKIVAVFDPEEHRKVCDCWKYNKK